MNPPKDFVTISPDDNLDTFPAETSQNVVPGEPTLFKRVVHEPGNDRPSRRVGSRSMAPRSQGTLSRPLRTACSRAIEQFGKLRHVSTRSVSGLLLIGAAASFLLSLGLYGLVLRQRPPAPVSRTRASLVLTSMAPFIYPAPSDAREAVPAEVLQDHVVLASQPAPARRPAVLQAARFTTPPLAPPAVEPDEPGRPVTFGRIPEATPAVTDSADRIAALPETPAPTPQPRPASPSPATLATAPAGPPPAAPPSAGSSVRLPAAPPPPAASAAAARTPDTTTVDAIVRRYRMAFNNLDASALVSVWPSVNAKAIGHAFDQIDSQAVTFDRCVTQPRNSGAVVTCSGRAAWVPRVGNRSPRVESRRWTFTLEKGSQGWVIRQVNAQRTGD